MTKSDVKMIRMADVIDLAINRYLWNGRNDDARDEVREYSCHAIVVADNFGTTEAMNFLQSMGMNPHGVREFRSIQFGLKRQYARALWLTWAAMISREEGKTL